MRRSPSILTILAAAMQAAVRRPSVHETQLPGFNLTGASKAATAYVAAAFGALAAIDHMHGEKDIPAAEAAIREAGIRSQGLTAADWVRVSLYEDSKGRKTPTVIDLHRLFNNGCVACGLSA